MDPIITKLTQAVTQKTKALGDQPAPSQGPESFQSTFDQTMADRLLEKMRDDYGMGGKNEMTVISADDIHVKTLSPETAPTGETTGAGDTVFDTFKQMNKDLLSLDSAMEVLTTPGLKITPRQLLAMQAGIANTSLMAEGFSKFTDALSHGIQTIVQQQVG